MRKIKKYTCDGDVAIVAQLKGTHVDCTVVNRELLQMYE
jgi:hypothetical protein